MRVEALDPDPGTTDTTARTGVLPVFGEVRVPLLRVTAMRRGQERRVNGRFCFPDPACRFELAHIGADLGVDEPVVGGHRGAVEEHWCVSYDHGAAVGSTDHDGERAVRRPAEERRHVRDVLVRRSVQRQNSRVRAMRERKPPDPEDVVAGCLAWEGSAVVVVVTPPGGSSELAEGVTGPFDPGSLA